MQKQIAQKKIQVKAVQKPKRVQMSSQTQDHPYSRAQGIIGNHGILSRYGTEIIQAKLNVGSPNDRYEQEADRIADQIMRMSESHFSDSEKQEKEIKQSAEMSNAPLRVIQRIPKNPQNTPFAGEIIPWSAALRDSPSHSGRVLADLPRGHSVIVTGGRAWISVETILNGTEMTGYVSHELIRATTATPSLAPVAHAVPEHETVPHSVPEHAPEPEYVTWTARRFVRDYADVIISVAEAHKIDPVAIAGVISWERIENKKGYYSDLLFQMSQCERGTIGETAGLGFGSVHLGVAKDIEESGRVPAAADIQERCRRLLDPEWAIYYIAQIMDESAKNYENIAGVDIRDKPEILATLFHTGKSDEKAEILRERIASFEEAHEEGEEPPVPLPDEMGRWILEKKGKIEDWLFAGEEVEEEREEEILQPKEVPGSTPVVTPCLEFYVQSLNTGGRPLPESIRAFFEPRFGYDFSNVRMHTGAQAAKAARLVNAQAFTLGRSIVFGTDQPTSETSIGRQLLAHELTHVLQQTVGEPVVARKDGCYGNKEVVSRQGITGYVRRQAEEPVQAEDMKMQQEAEGSTQMDLARSIIEQLFIGKTFAIEDENALLRNADLSPVRYQEGEESPEGKKVGDAKTIPPGTEVNVLSVKVQPDKKTYAYVVQRRPSSVNGLISGPISGWTAVTNFRGKFENIVIGASPGESLTTPQPGLFQTVGDPVALIRGEGPDYNPTGDKIPLGTYVLVIGQSMDTDLPGRYVQVREFLQVEGGYRAGEILGWTVATNLVEGWADIYGPNAAWEAGKYIGQIDLVNIVGENGEREQIATKIFPRYVEMVKAAEGDGVRISIESGFRTYQMQAYLRREYLAGRGNKAAVPGRSRHQNGIAVDFNTEGSGGTGCGEVYNWLKDNAWKYGFIRTVESEHWHWVYLPNQVQEGKHTTWGK